LITDVVYILSVAANFDMDSQTVDAFRICGTAYVLFTQVCNFLQDFAEFVQEKTQTWRIDI